MAASKVKTPTSYGLLLFPGFEVLDTAGPMEALNVLVRFMDKQDLKLSVISETLDPVDPGPVAPDTSGINFNAKQLYQPTHTFETAPHIDVLTVPGGIGTRQTDEELKSLLSFIRDSCHGTNGRSPAQYLFSVCTGSLLFARAGILDGHRATTNKKAWSKVTATTRTTHWIAEARWVVSGNIWTCSGVSAGIDGMVAFIASIYGDETAKKVCNVMEYSRAVESHDDPFAAMNGCQDVLPVEDV